MTEKLIQYLRPTSKQEAWALKEKFGDKAQFLFRGNFQPWLEENAEVLIDLQDTNLDDIEWTGPGLRFGGLTTLKQLEEALDVADFREALNIEYGLNVRNSLSLSNFLSQTNGRSPVLCCMMALGSRIATLNNAEEISLTQFLLDRVSEDPAINLFMPEPKLLAFESVGRSPKDLPIVCVSTAKSIDGNIRVAVGGTKKVLPGFTLQGFDDDGQEQIKSLLSDTDDEWASAEYRQEVGAVLLSRALQKLHLQAGHQEAK